MSFRLRFEALEDRSNPVGPVLLDPTPLPISPGEPPPADPAPPPADPATPPAQQQPEPAPVPGVGPY